MNRVLKNSYVYALTKNAIENMKKTDVLRRFTREEKNRLVKMDARSQKQFIIKTLTEGWISKN